MKKFSYIIVLSLILTSCATSKVGSSSKLQKYNFSQLSGWKEQNIKGGFEAFKKTCSALSTSKIRSEKVFSQNYSTWQNKCILARNARSPKLFFETNFIPYLVTNNGSSRGLFTGYFEIEIAASLRKDHVYKYPIYRTPDDKNLLNLSRKEIENGALNGKNLEIAYARSAAELYFLQIQGSGILRMPDGKKINVGFAAKNNKEYTGIGRYMLDEGLIQHGTAKDIKNWLEQHPVTGRTIMNMNDRFVFFSLKSGGPYGSLGVELTDGGSLAVDPAYMPLGMPLWLQTTIPGMSGYYTRLVAAQDTGSDIKGPIRGDIFFGEGDWAETTAGKMKQQGSYFMLLPKEINPGLYF